MEERERDRPEEIGEEETTRPVCPCAAVDQHAGCGPEVEVREGYRCHHRAIRARTRASQSVPHRIAGSGEDKPGDGGEQPAALTLCLGTALEREVGREAVVHRDEAERGLGCEAGEGGVVGWYYRHRQVSYRTHRAAISVEEVRK